MNGIREVLGIYRLLVGAEEIQEFYILLLKILIRLIKEAHEAVKVLLIGVHVLVALDIRWILIEDLTILAVHKEGMDHHMEELVIKLCISLYGLLAKADAVIKVFLDLGIGLKLPVKARPLGKELIVDRGYLVLPGICKYRRYDQACQKRQYKNCIR